MHTPFFAVSLALCCASCLFLSISDTQLCPAALEPLKVRVKGTEVALFSDTKNDAHFET